MAIGYCEQCAFWHQGNPRGQGACRARAPIVIEESEAQPLFPITKEDDWCGGFEPRASRVPFKPTAVS